DVAGILTTVATEPGQLMNEADVFVQLTPQHLRKKKQQEISIEIRKELEKIEDIRVVVRDQSTEGFTAQRGDPVDFTIQADWKKRPGFGYRIMNQMAEATNAGGQRLVHDIDSDYRPGMPELRIKPDREKLAQINMPVGRLADSMSLLVGGERVAKFTSKNR